MKASVPKTKSYIITDRLGNRLLLKNFYDESDLFHPVTAELFIFLKNRKRQRRIGVIDYALKTLFVVRNANKHLHRKSNSFGFNDAVLKEKSMFDIEKIHLTEVVGGNSFLIPKSVILEKGKYLHFMDKGFELQRFLHIAFILPHKIKTQSHGTVTQKKEEADPEEDYERY